MTDIVGRLRAGFESRTLGDFLLMNEAADEIERLQELLIDDSRLRDELIKAEKEIERLRGELSSATRAINSLAERSNAWRNDAEQSQAREAKLRSVLAPLRDALQGTYSLSPEGRKELAKINDALTLPHDDTALKERLKQERERCADRARAYAYMSPNFDVLADEILDMGDAE